MIINPNKAVEQGYLTNIANKEEQIQQNGIDLTLKSIAAIQGDNLLTLDARAHAARVELVAANGDGVYHLNPGTYEVIYNEEFNIPNGVCAMVMSRSTIIRGGNFVMSGLYDAGFKGVGGGVLHVTVPLTIQLNVRIAQVVFQQSEQGELYDGIYQSQTVA